MTHDAEWLRTLLEELAEREVFPPTPPFAARFLEALVSPSESHWGKKMAFLGAATVSVSAVTLLVLRIITGRWVARGHA
ncbi:MAG: hypothetical protein M0R73_09515 [Dehalococcoidia bacterium]|nr:hypothetical protein [Dehalococcoidia bacterium]